MVKAFLKKLLSQCELEKKYLYESIHFWRITRRYNASTHTDYDIEKMQYTLLRENHTIEKGMSMRNPRKGFGQQKVICLLGRLKKYVDNYSNENSLFLDYPLSTIQNYIDYTKSNGTEIPKIEYEFHKLLEAIQKESVDGHAGIERVTREDINMEAKENFERLLFSRHSIRYFEKEIPSRELLIKALELAQRTPSACNRQGWLTHIFLGKKSFDLLKWQSGCRGFEDEIKCSILVTANLKAFLSYEVHQAYVDGGLYAMNLINALHYLGLGTIPLSTAFDYRKLKELQKFGIPENEVPILIIGVGNMQRSFNIAVSSRKDVNMTNKWHN